MRSSALLGLSAITLIRQRHLARGINPGPQPRYKLKGIELINQRTRFQRFP